MKSIRIIFLAISFTIVYCSSAAYAGLLSNTNNILNAKQAFILSPIEYTNNVLKIKFDIAPNTYLYRHTLKFSNVEDTFNISKRVIPNGELKHDEFFGDVEIYHDILEAKLTLTNAKLPLHIEINYQGCAASGFCYPPQTSWIFINEEGVTSVLESLTDIPAEKKPTNALASSEQNNAENAIHNNSLWVAFGIFFGLGLLLSFTPCVLPMIPILSSIIAGHKHQLSMLKGVTLSTSYVLGMSTSYAMLGLVVGSIGTNLQTLLQAPWVIILFSTIFILLALSEFKILPFHILHSLSNKINTITRKFKGGHYIPVFIMGALAALIVSPCVTPALVGALAYISHTSDAFSGSVSLFALGFGMGAPLILVGAFGAHVLPKSGQWMDNISYFFGTLLIAIAIWLLTRILPNNISLFLWSIFLLCVAVYLGAFNTQVKHPAKKLCRGLGLFSFIYAIILIISALTGGTSPLYPLKHLNITEQMQNNLNVAKSTEITVNSSTQLNNAIKSSLSKYNRPIILEYYADWCSTCKQIEGNVLSKASVRAALAKVTFIKVNITETNTTTQTLMKKFDVFAPPVFIFLDSTGKENSNLRLVGELKEETLLEHINKQ